LEQENSDSSNTENKPDGLEDDSGATRDIGAHAQQLNLPDPQNRARFEVTDIDWPTEDLTPSICMWHKDKVAAVSVSIDDKFSAGKVTGNDTTTKAQDIVTRSGIGNGSGDTKAFIQALVSKDRLDLANGETVDSIAAAVDVARNQPRPQP